MKALWDEQLRGGYRGEASECICDQALPGWFMFEKGKAPAVRSAGAEVVWSG